MPLQLNCTTDYFTVYVQIVLNKFYLYKYDKILATTAAGILP